MLHRAFLAAATIALLGVGSAVAQDQIDPAQMCDAAAAAYQAYALNNTDPDLKEANHLVTEGVYDCRNGDADRGIKKVNEAMARIHDHTKTR
jgi:hypothetical protein